MSNYPFSFANVEKQFESFRGSYVSVRYYLKVTISRKYNEVTKECEFLVLNPVSIEELAKNNEPVKSEVKF